MALCWASGFYGSQHELICDNSASHSHGLVCTQTYYLYPRMKANFATTNIRRSLFPI
jgi:hypothetical protein